MLSKTIYRLITNKIQDFDRVIIDEAHSTTISSTFHPVFKTMNDLASIPCQKIYLTATLPPQLEKEFLEFNSLSLTTPIIRAQTNRPELRYHVFQTHSKTNSVNSTVCHFTNRF